jgi:CheY-like chemotaxis protein
MKSILVIDDNSDIRENTAEILDLAGYKTFTAENGKAGVEVALREKPDLIVCDIMMPELDGYGVLHLLKKNTQTENIPFSQQKQNGVISGKEWKWAQMIISPNHLKILNS